MKKQHLNAGFRIWLILYGTIAYLLLKIVLSIGIEINGLEIALIVYCVAAFFFLHLRLSKESQRIIWLFILLIIFMTVEGLLMQNGDSLKQIFKYVEILIITLGLNFLASDNVTIHRVLLITLIVPTIIMALEGTVLFALDQATKLNISTGISATVYFYFTKRIRLFMISFIYSLLSSFALSYRTDMVLMVVLTFVFILLCLPKQTLTKIRSILFFVVICAAVITLLFISQSNLVSYVGELFEIGKPTASNLERASLISFSLQTIKANFLFGIGSGRFTDTYLSSPYRFRFSRNITAHNHYLEIFVENGVFVFAIFLLIIIWVSITQIRNVRIASRIGHWSLSMQKALLLIWFSQAYYILLSPFSGKMRVSFAIVIGLVTASSSTIRTKKHYKTEE